MALLEAEERVHVSAAAAVVVRLANIVPVRKKPPWLLKKRDNFLRGKCTYGFIPPRGNFRVLEIEDKKKNPNISLSQLGLSGLFY